MNEKPLLTFALFAYNQEQYIREAVEGAFAQTYEPLEIILSDDCSTDRTFEIMQEMAAGYEGPHEVRVRQSIENRGTFAHVLDVANESKGEILVVAAGDDISLPERTKIIVPEFCSDNIGAVSSDDTIIDENSNKLVGYEERIQNRNIWHKNNPTWIHGASAAYRLGFLKSLPCSKKKLLFEDMIFIDLMKVFQFRSVRINEKLIKYRFHQNNLSSRHKKSIQEAEKAAMLKWRNSFEAKQYCLDVIVQMRDITCDFDSIYRKVSEERDFLWLLSCWPDLKIKKKIKLLQLGIKEKKIKTVIIRLFGTNFFLLIRYLQQFWRKHK